MPGERGIKLRVLIVLLSLVATLYGCDERSHSSAQPLETASNTEEDVISIPASGASIDVVPVDGHDPNSALVLAVFLHSDKSIGANSNDSLDLTIFAVERRQSTVNFRWVSGPSPPAAHVFTYEEFRGWLASNSASLKVSQEEFQSLLMSGKRGHY